MPPGVTIRTLVRAIDAAHNVSYPTGSQITLRATVGYAAEEIYVREGIVALERYANTAGLRIAEQTAAAAALRASLRRLSRFASKTGGILAFIGSFLSDTGNLSCEQGPIMRMTKNAFANAGQALKAAGEARVGRNLTLTDRVVDARSALDGLEDAARHNIDVLVDRQCQAPSRTALGVIGKTTPALDDALRRAAALQAQTAAQRPKIGLNTCVDARELVRTLGRAAADRTTSSTGLRHRHRTTGIEASSSADLQPALQILGLGH